MKDLNRVEVYSLDGITHEQAEELLQWLIENDTEWESNHLEYLVNHKSIYFDTGWNEWLLGSVEYYNPTTHISTLFEKSYEEQLIEAVRRVEELKRKINEPKVGEWMFMKGRGFKIVQHEKQASGLKNQGWQKVTDPFTLETLNNYNK